MMLSLRDVSTAFRTLLEIAKDPTQVGKPMRQQCLQSITEGRTRGKISRAADRLRRLLAQHGGMTPPIRGGAVLAGLACMGALCWGCAATDADRPEPRAAGFDPDEAEAVFSPAPAYSPALEAPAWEGDEQVDPGELAALQAQLAQQMGLSVGSAPTPRASGRAGPAGGGSSGRRVSAGGEPGLWDEPMPSGARDGGRGGAGSGEDEFWSIAIAAFNGPQARAMGEEGLRRVRSLGGLPRAYLRPKNDGWVISYGRYDAPTDENAQRDLRRIRATEVNGSRPFATAFLAAPEITASAGRDAVLDLRRAKARYGPEALYSLQVGYYGRIDRAPTPEERAAFRASAEEATRDLRAQGELAFFYHATNGSMVTIGVFTEDDHDRATGMDSARLRAVRERFPHNLFNGAGIRESVRTRDGGSASRLQPSVLVAIPEQ